VRLEKMFCATLFGIIFYIQGVYQERGGRQLCLQDSFCAPTFWIFLLDHYLTAKPAANKRCMWRTLMTTIDSPASNAPWSLPNLLLQLWQMDYCHIFHLPKPFFLIQSDML
jgi:hypothetical protein